MLINRESVCGKLSIVYSQILYKSKTILNFFSKKFQRVRESIKPQDKSVGHQFEDKNIDSLYIYISASFSVGLLVF